MGSFVIHCYCVHAHATHTIQTSTIRGLACHPFHRNHIFGFKFLYLDASFDKKKLLSVLLLVHDCSRRNKQLDGRRTGTGYFYISDTQTALSFTVPKLQYHISQNNQASTAVFDRQQYTKSPFLAEPVIY